MTEETKIVDEKLTENPEKPIDKPPCPHKYWNWVWKGGIWTDTRVCTTCGKVEKCEK